MKSKSLSSPEQLTTATARHFPRAEILVSYPDRWQLVHQFRRNEKHLFVAGFPPSHERSRGDHFFGLSPELNRSLTTYRLYKLFEPWPAPLFHMVWDAARNEGRILDGGRLRVQLHPLGQAQMWKGTGCGVLWECYAFETWRRRPDWQEELGLFWQAVERDMGVNRIYTQPHEPTFEEGYREFLGQLGYTPDPDFNRWWSKRL